MFAHYIIFSMQIKQKFTRLFFPLGLMLVSCRYTICFQSIFCQWMQRCHLLNRGRKRKTRVSAAGTSTPFLPSPVLEISSFMLKNKLVPTTQAFWLEAKPTSCQAMCHYKNLTSKGKTVHENSLAISIVWYRVKVPEFHWHTCLLKVCWANHALHPPAWGKSLAI